MRLSEPTTKIWMKIDPYRQRQKCRRLTLVSLGNKDLCEYLSESSEEWPEDELIISSSSGHSEKKVSLTRLLNSLDVFTIIVKTSRLLTTVYHVAEAVGINSSGAGQIILEHLARKTASVPLSENPRWCFRSSNSVFCKQIENFCYMCWQHHWVGGRVIRNETGKDVLKNGHSVLLFIRIHVGIYQVAQKTSRTFACVMQESY